MSTGDSVKRGDALIKCDGALLKSKGKDATTMIVITNGDDAVKSMTKNLNEKSSVLTVAVK